MTSFAADRSRRTTETDRWLAGMLGAEPGVALVAVGGYGRKEMLPGSDLDVLLLHDGRDDIAKVADRIWYPVWDSGARLDHAVRTVPQARRVARGDLKVALGLLYARHVAGDPELTTRLREGALEDWRAHSRTRLAELREMGEERARMHGELAFLLEPDLKESRGGQRDVHAIQAIAAAWVAPAPGPRVRAAYEQIIDARHVLHEVTGRHVDRLVLEEQDEVARALGLLDGDALLRNLAGAGRTVAYAADHAFRQADRAGGRKSLGVRMRRAKPERRPLADGVVEQDGEVVLARAADPAADAVLVLRAAAAAAQHGLPLAPRALARLADCPPLPVPWPDDARDALIALLGAGPNAIAVWEALDQEGLLTALIPDWERVRNRPQRNPLHTFTVDRHLVECAANAAALTRDVSRPDLLLLAALMHDIGKGWPGDHSVSGEVVARDFARRVGLGEADAGIIAAAVRHHLLLPVVATRRDLDDPVTVQSVAGTVGSRLLLEILRALSQADGLATGPAAWNDWKAGLVADLVRRVAAALDGDPVPGPAPLRDEQLALVAGGGPAAIVKGSEVTVVALDRPGLLWRAAGVLASHRLAVRGATATSVGDTAVTVFSVAPEYGDPPDADLVAADLRRMLEGRLDVQDRLDRRARAVRATGAAAPPPKVALVDSASDTATVVEVRAHDEPGLLWRIGRALGDCGLDVRAARVETLGAEAVDVFYVTDAEGGLLTDPESRQRTVTTVLNALRPELAR
ncbi:MAG TPA: [protein-PII] uridylyltransferase [Trebonia sp.]|nr:[protein-PII] uridylyltransferase [Trebonia sp.]